MIETERDNTEIWFKGLTDEREKNKKGERVREGRISFR